MALSAQDLLAFREQIIAYDTLQKGTLDSRIEELKKTLADLQAYSDLDTASKDLDKKKADLESETTAVKFELDRQTQAVNDHALALQVEEEALKEKEQTFQEDEQMLMADRSRLIADTTAFEKFKADSLDSLKVREDAVVAQESVYATKADDLAAREAVVAHKLEVLKSL